MIPKKSKRKVVLFNPSPWSGIRTAKQTFLPLSLLFLAPPLEKLGYEITIINQPMDRNWKQKLKAALEDDPVCFGVTCMTGPQILRAVESCLLVKAQCPELPIVWGGVHASVRPTEVLAESFVDIVVIGEGEETFAELVSAIDQAGAFGKIKGIGYKKDGKQYFTEPRPFIDLNKHPAPSYHLLDMNKYRYRIMGKDHIHILFSRGCIYDCAYCWDPVFNQKKYRTMDPDLILEHISRVARDYGIKGLIFGDDNFFIDLDWAYTVLEKIVNSGLGISIGRLFIRADTLCRLDKDFLDLIVRAGTSRLAIGAESGSPRILRLIKKRITVEEVLEGNRKLLDYPIRPQYLFMLGIPTETREEIRQSIDLAEKLMGDNPKATRSFNIYAPFPGTELFRKAVEEGFQEPDRLGEWAGVSYRRQSAKLSWLSRDVRDLVAILDWALMCDEHDGQLGKIKRGDPLSICLARGYRPMARYRVKSLDTRFPVELGLIKGIRKMLGRDKEVMTEQSF